VQILNCEIVNQEELKQRTKNFTINIILLLRSFQKSKELDVISYQLIKSASSVGANYRACCRAKSKADFINKLKIIEEEADESCFWLEILRELHLDKASEVNIHLKEAKEITAIFTSAGKTARIEKNISKFKN
jgi:four helix bundle protein